MGPPATSGGRHFAGIELTGNRVVAGVPRAMYLPDDRHDVRCEARRVGFKSAMHALHCALGVGSAEALTSRFGRRKRRLGAL